MTMAPPRSTSVCVIGGGPAGSCIALSLARLGREVTLLETARFPRHHVGEALPAPVLSLLEEFGLRERVEASDVFRGRNAIIRWADDKPSHKVHQGVPGLQVNRSAFDALLLAAAREAGVRVLQPARTAKPRRRATGNWSISYRSGENQGIIDAGFVIDATGRRGLLSPSKRDDGPRTTALYGYWQATPLRAGTTLIDVQPSAWLWGGMVPGEGFNAMVFLDGDNCRGRHPDRRQLYLDHLAQSALFKDCLSGRLPGAVRACDATATHREDCCGVDFVKVGEAAFALDPLSSQGVLAALTTALHGSIVVNTILSNPARTRTAMDFYRERVEEAIARNRRYAASSYAEQSLYTNSKFWCSRAQREDVTTDPTPPVQARHVSMDHPIRLAAGIKIATKPVVVGEHIEPRPALCHADWDRPLAFVRGIPIGDVAIHIAKRSRVVEVLHDLAPAYGRNRTLDAMTWLHSHGILATEPS